MIERLTLVHELPRQLGIENVSFDETKVRVLQVVLDIGHLAQREIVQDHNLVALGQESIGQVRAYVARSSGNQCSHSRLADRLSVDLTIG
jgi:hypothetical protein